jgi:hypothetical protein
MADRRPLVFLADFTTGELPVGDTLAWTWLSGVPANLTSWAAIAPADKANDADVVKTSGTQSNLAGAKSWTGSHTFDPNAATGLTVSRAASASNVSIAYTLSGGTIYAGAASNASWRIAATNNLMSAPWFEATSTGANIAGNVAYHAGNLTAAIRNAIPLTTSNANYTFVAADAGTGRRKTNTTAYSYTVDGSVFAAGDSILVLNNAGTSNITIVQGSGMTLRLAGSATTGNRTVAPHGHATIYFSSATEAYVSGPGVT